ncbi:MAG TPA: metallophosphoesterase [Panacibacter sp.]|nr:metallophosphoesterase [Panacibacter sp.]
MNLFKRILKFLLERPVTWIANRFSSAPKQENVNASLSKLYKQSADLPGQKSGSMFFVDPAKQPIIIFSDQHKGARDGADDFGLAEANYLAALDYYNAKDFYFVNLGDSEELWENTIFNVIKHNQKTFDKEKLFIARNAYCKIIGNHDLFWKNDPLVAPVMIKKIFGTDLKIFEAILLRIQLDQGFIDVFCTHGHQGDAQSDGNAFSKWFVSYVWGPLQSLLEINTNTPSANNQLKSIHNGMMYQWAIKQPGALLITGHTHQPVFKSLTHLERLYLKLEEAREKNDTAAIEKIESEIPRRRREYDFVNHSYRNMNPSYFNTGCCCFEDGTITGIEIAEGYIRLVKWSYINGIPERFAAEEALLAELASLIK